MRAKPRSRASLGGIRPSLGIQHTGAPHSFHSSESQANMFTTRIPLFESTTPRLSVPPKIEHRDVVSIPIALHQEQSVHEQYEHDQPPAQPQHPPRRSARIRAMRDAIPPKVKTQAKSTGRKRAIRKK